MVTTHSGSPLALRTNDLRGGAAGISMERLLGVRPARVASRPVPSLASGSRLRAHGQNSTHIHDEGPAARSWRGLRGAESGQPVMRMNTGLDCQIERNWIVLPGRGASICMLSPAEMPAWRGLQVRSPGLASLRLTPVPAFFWLDVVRGRLMPSLPYTYCVKPEQSKPLGELPPER